MHSSCARPCVRRAADVPELLRGQRGHGVQLARELRVVAVVALHVLHVYQASAVVTLLSGQGFDLTRSVCGGRRYQGTVHYERKWKGDYSLEGQETRAQIERIKKNRNWGQPYVRSVQVLCCSEVLALNVVSPCCSSLGICSCYTCSGWHTHPRACPSTHRAVFVNNGWRIADTVGAAPLDTDVLSAYVPLVGFHFLIVLVKEG